MIQFLPQFAEIVKVNNGNCCRCGLTENQHFKAKLLSVLFYCFFFFPLKFQCAHNY